MQHDHQTSPRPAATGWLLPSALATLGVFAWACEDGGSGSGDAGADGGGLDGEITRRDVLTSVADQVLVPVTGNFATTATSLKTSVEAWVAADATGADAALVAAQEAWTAAFLQWQQLEVMQVGPAAPSLTGPGGEDLRDAIYSWPTADTCSVDRALVEQDYAAADFFATELVWAYGLDALEYLLFVHGEAHTCPAQVELDAPWAALGIEEIKRRRAAYAAVVAAGIADQAATLASRWAPTGGDFAALLAAPGEGDSPYDSDAQALDDVFRVMFYLDKQAKDGKLGAAIGLVEGCAAVPCVELMEAPHSGVAAAAIAANLEGLRHLVQGGPDPATADGFDDLLEQIGQGQIAQTLLADIDVAVEIAHAQTAPLQELTAADPDALLPLHAAVKEVSDTLKGPFMMALMLTIPAEGAGDND
jgi:predicted lipoprotein